jgi:hypothetical protein
MKLLTILKESKEIKRLIVERSMKYGIPLRHLCWECNIEYQRFMNEYINLVNGSTMDIDEESFKELLAILGIKIRYQIIVDDGLEVIEHSKILSQKYERRKT